MASTRKTAIYAPKTSLTSAGTQPTRENTQTDSSRATKRTTNSSTLKPVKPLRTHASSSNDAEMNATLASLRAEIDQLKKLQAAKPLENKLEQIPRPSKITNLQHAMGLTDDKKLYSHCRSTVRDVVTHAGLPFGVDWRLQDVVAVGKIAQVASSRNKQLGRYKGNWATLEIMKTMLKNRRCYKQRIGSPCQDITNDGEQEAGEEEKGKEGEGEKEGGAGGNDDEDWDSMYMPKGIDKDDGIGGEDRIEEEVGDGMDGIMDDIEVLGRNDGDRDDIEEFVEDDDEGRNGEGSRSAERLATTGLARTKKRKANHDDEPATTTRAAGKRKKVDHSGGDQAASSTKKAPPKRKNLKKKD